MARIPERAQKASEILTVRIHARTTPAFIERVRTEAGGNVSKFVRDLLAEAVGEDGVRGYIKAKDGKP